MQCSSEDRCFYISAVSSSDSALSETDSVMGSGQALDSIGFLARYECLHSIILRQLRHSFGMGVFFGRVFRYPNSCLQLASSAGFFSYDSSTIDFGSSFSALVSTVA